MTEPRAPTTRQVSGQNQKVYESIYNTGRALAEFVSGVGWVGVAIGGFVGIVALTRFGENALQGFLLIAAGLGMAVTGFLLVGVGQFTRAAFDTADNTGEMRNHLRLINLLLDPDGTKMEAAQRSEEARLQVQNAMERQRREAEEQQRRAEKERRQAEHQAQIVREKEEQRRKEVEEQERKSRMKREKEEKKLAESRATLKCLFCKRRITVKDLRSGAKHSCPHCTQVFEIEEI